MATVSDERRAAIRAELPEVEEIRDAGLPSIRHPAYGVHVCLTVGLPETVAYIAGCHSGEGELVVRSLECQIVHQADHTFWRVALAGGLVDPASVPKPL